MFGSCRKLSKNDLQRVGTNTWVSSLRILQADTPTRERPLDVNHFLIIYGSSQKDGLYGFFDNFFSMICFIALHFYVEIRLYQQKSRINCNAFCRL